MLGFTELLVGWAFVDHLPAEEVSQIMMSVGLGNEQNKLPRSRPRKTLSHPTMSCDDWDKS